MSQIINIKLVEGQAKRFHFFSYLYSYFTAYYTNRYFYEAISIIPDEFLWYLFDKFDISKTIRVSRKSVIQEKYA